MVGWQEAHPDHKIPVPVIPKILIQNRWRSRRREPTDAGLPGKIAVKWKK